MTLSVVILAAGLGKRMHSKLPKVLHPLAHRPLIHYVLETALSLQPRQIYLVYGHQGEQLQAALQQFPVHWIHQPQQLGTGHAVAQALPVIPNEDQVLILYGDVPLIRTDTLQKLLLKADSQYLTLLTVHLSQPTGYGRIVRNSQGQVTRIVEEREADAHLKQIQEVNTGILVVPAHQLRQYLGQLSNHNAQGEYYLTDIVGLAVQSQYPVHTVTLTDPYEALGVNDRAQLAQLERHWQRQQTQQLMQAGVTLRDPDRLDIRGTVHIAHDVELDIDIILEGQVTLEEGVKIGPYTRIKNAHISKNAEILSHCVIEGAIIGEGARIGPFARIRPDTVLAEHVHIGNFVELKKSTVAQHSKINHLSYIGDTEIGQRVNIGAGTITCNYDGVNKHKTLIGDDAFIGSDTQLIAPVTVGAGATIGAGTTLTLSAPPQELTLSRAEQITVKGWRRPVKK